MIVKKKTEKEDLATFRSKKANTGNKYASTASVSDIMQLIVIVPILEILHAKKLKNTDIQKKLVVQKYAMNTNQTISITCLSIKHHEMPESQGKLNTFVVEDDLSDLVVATRKISFWEAGVQRAFQRKYIRGYYAPDKSISYSFRFNKDGSTKERKKNSPEK